MEEFDRGSLSCAQHRAFWRVQSGLLDSSLPILRSGGGTRFRSLNRHDRETLATIVIGRWQQKEGGRERGEKGRREGGRGSELGDVPSAFCKVSVCLHKEHCCDCGTPSAGIYFGIFLARPMWRRLRSDVVNAL